MSSRDQSRYSFIRFPGGEPVGAIDDATFTQIAGAHEFILLALSLEEKLDLLVANYAEYEADLLRLALDRSLHPQGEWSTYRYDFQNVNRRVVNVLSAARLYLDQVMHEVCATYGQGSAHAERLKHKIAQEYDGHLEYRVMETVRNHVQHRSLPVGELMSPIDYEEIGRGVARWRFSVVPYLDIESLEANPKAKRAVIREFANLVPSPDLTYCLRVYLECLCRIHELVRAIYSNDMDASLIVLTRARADAMVMSSAGTTGVAVLVRDDRGQPDQVFHLSSTAIEQVNRLRARNSSFEDLADRYAASRR